jgi:hypothetical protein
LIPPNIEKLEAKGDVQDLIKALKYEKFTSEKCGF